MELPVIPLLIYDHKKKIKCYELFISLVSEIFTFIRYSPRSTLYWSHTLIHYIYTTTCKNPGSTWHELLGCRGCISPRTLSLFHTHLQHFLFLCTLPSSTTVSPTRPKILCLGSQSVSSPSIWGLTSQFYLSSKMFLQSMSSKFI